MPLSSRTALARSVLAGTATGLRSQLGLAAVLATTAQSRLPRPARGRAGKATLLLAAGELVIDKLPSTPNRTERPGLIGRLVLGGLCGPLLGPRLSPRNVPQVASSALAGAGAAAAATFGGLVLRRMLSKRYGPLPGALVEDGIAMALAFGATRLSARRA